MLVEVWQKGQCQPMLSIRFLTLYLLLLSMQCADLVFDEMQRIAAQCETTELTRFPLLRERVAEVVHGE